MAIGGSTSHDAYTAAAGEQIAAVSALGEAYTALKDQQLAELAEVLDAQEQVNGSLGEGTDQAQGFAGGLGKLGGELMQVHGALLAVGAVAAAAATAVKWVGNETAKLDHIAKSAQKEGLGFEGYQRLAHMAKLSGTTVEDLGKGTVKLQRNLRDLDGTGKEAAEALAELGINAKDLANKSDTERLAILAGELSKLPDGANKSAIAVEILGRNGKELIPLFNAGADGVRAMSESIDGTFTREQLASAEAYQDALANLERRADLVKGTVAAELAPALTEVADGLEAGAKEAARSLPLVLKYVTTVGKGLQPVVAVVTFFGRQLAIVGRTVDVAGKYFGEAADAAGDLADRLTTTAKESRFGEWAAEASESVLELGDGAFAGLTDRIEEHLPFARDVARAWEDVARQITGAELAASEMTSIAAAQQRIVGFFDSVKTTTEDAAEAEEKRVEALQKGVIEAEHAVNLAEAQKRPARELEELYRAQHQARVDLLAATKEQKDVEQAIRDEEVRQAAASVRRGGRGPSDADKMKAAGEIQLAIWRDRLALMEAEAALRGTADETAAEAARVRHRLAVEELELERQTLEVTRGRNSVERERNEARIEAIGREVQILDLQQRIADRQAEAELIARATEETRERAGVEAELRRQEQAGIAEVISLEEYRSQRQVEDLESRGELEAAGARNAVERLAIVQRVEREVHEARMRQRRTEHEAAVRELDAREAAAEAMGTSTEPERLRRQDELRQVAHAREVERLQYERDVRREMEAEQVAALEREKARVEQQLALVDQGLAAFEGFRAQASQLAGFLTERNAAEEDAALQRTVNTLRQRGQAQSDALDAEILAAEGNAQRQAELRRKQARQEASIQQQIERAEAAHLDRRKRAEMRAAGVQLMIAGVVETVKAIVAFASFNYLEGALHVAAAVVAFTQGGMLLSGRIPGGGAAANLGTGGGGMAAGGGRETVDPSDVPGSIPGEAARRESGSVQGTGTRDRGQVININGPINATGAIDEDTAITIGRAIGKVGYAREA